MRISCKKCDNHEQFYIALWVRATFRFKEDGTIEVLHTRQLESLEERLTNQKLYNGLKCNVCNSEAVVSFDNNEHFKQLETLEAM